MKLKYDKLLSNFTVNCKLRPSTLENISNVDGNNVLSARGVRWGDAG